MDTPILGQITSVSVATVDSLQKSGDVEKSEIVKFKLESASIEDAQMSEFYPEVITMIRSISPCPAEEIKLSKVFTKLLLKITPENEDGEFLPGVGLESEESSFGRCEISKMTVKIKGDIPIYIFEMHFPIGYGNIPDMVGFYKKRIKFEFSDYIYPDGEEEKTKEQTLFDLEKTTKKHKVSVTLKSGDKSVTVG